MAGFLGQGWDDPRSQANMALAAGLLQGNMGAGLLGANQAYGQAKNDALKQQYLKAQMDETLAQARERQIKAQREEQALELERRKRTVLPTLFNTGGGLVGGAPAPQMEGNIPMFSRPMGVTPMQSQPAGGLDWMRALQEGYTTDEIAKLAAMPDIGRPKATRQMEVDDGKGGKRIALVDDFGREVAGFSGYTAPVQVNQGDRVSFVKPAPGVSLPMNMSPDARASNALGWANHGLSKQRLSLDASNAQAGKAPAGYRWAVDGKSLEPIPGGPAVKSENASEGERKAATLLQRLEGSQKQLQEVLGSTPGAAKPEIVPATIRALGAPDAANVTTSEARQRVEAAQLDMLDAALTLGTGAAYTREQLEGYRRSYFPQIGDEPKTVKDKQDRLNNVIQAARIAAGRAGGGVSPAKGGATGGWSIQKVE